MQSDLSTIIDNDDNVDADSLFGSPPPSPGRGRSSPPLALPSGESSAQNVGTLALPGSHLVAELPVTPPALPLTSGTHVASQPPSRAATVQPPSAPPTFQRSSSAPLRSSTAERTLRKSKKAKEKSTTPRPTPPPIPLPSPDEPTPPNFLRNQQALLGLAGVVGGVNPANLSILRHTRGQSAENPIVVEDAPQAQPSISRRPRLAAVDPAQLPKPSSEQILGTLLKQKNIFPVVESLLRLLAPGSVTATSARPYYPPRTSFGRGSPPGQSQAPPLKRRKLSSVPAGAADWDVPYPFQAGQGPENYYTNWERERGKQLLADLVQLVQNAAKKAATKAYLQQRQHQEQKVRNHYRPATMTYGIDCTQTSLPPSAGRPSTSPAGEASQAGTSSSYPASNSLPQPSTPFDQLLDSILALQRQQQEQQPRQPDQSLQSQFEVITAGSRNHLSSSSSSTPHSSTPNVSENTPPYFDNWLSMLTSNPPGDPTDDGVDRDFDLLYFNSSIFSAPTPSESQPFPDFLIDPALLASEENSPPDSQPPASTSYGTVKRPVTASTSDTTVGSGPSGTGCAAVPPTPSLVDSPLASTSSLPDPGTPPPWEWPFPQELIEPDVTLSTGDQGASSCQIPCHANINLTQGQTEMVVTPTGSSTMLASLTPIATQPTPKPQAFFPQQIPYYPTTPLYQQTSLTPSQTQVQPQTVQPSTSSQARVSQPHAPTLKPAGRPPALAGPDRKATLHRAREMREALAAAVERAKVELWETTLEQGVLVGLTKEVLE